jgi:hypothetical protein
MNEDQKEWQRRFWANFGAKELMRLGLVYIAWLLTGIAVSRALNSAGYSVIFVAISVGIFMYAPYWQSAYTLVYRILGNGNIPGMLPKIKRNGGSNLPRYLALTIGLFIPSVLLFFGIRMIFIK